MKKNKELVEAFHQGLSCFFEKNIPHPCSLDLHFINDYYFEEYFSHVAQALYSLKFHDNGNRVYSNLNIYCLEKNRIPYLQSFVERFNSHFSINSNDSFISIFDIATDISYLSDLIRDNGNAANIILDSEKLTGEWSVVSDDLDGFKNVFTQLVKNISWFDDYINGKEIYLSCHSSINPDLEMEKFEVFFEPLSKLAILNVYNHGEKDKNINNTLFQAKDYLRENNIVKAKEVIEECSWIDDKAFIFLQVFDEFNSLNNMLYTPHLVDLITKIDLDIDFSVGAAIKIARICTNADCYPVARKILNKISDELITQEQIEEAIIISDESSFSEMKEKLLEILMVNYPDSLLIIRMRIQKALKEERYSDAAELFSKYYNSSNYDKSGFLLRFDNWVKNGGKDVLSFLSNENHSEMEGNNFINNILVKWLIKRKCYSDSISLMKNMMKIVHGNTFVNNSRLIFDAWFLNENGMKDKSVEDGLIDLLELVISTLSDKDVNPSVRENFINSFGWESSGISGRALLVLVARRKFLSEPIIITTKDGEGNIKMTPDEFELILEKCLVWISTASNVNLGRDVIPQDVFLQEKEGYLSFLNQLQTVSIAFANSFNNDQDLVMVNSFIFIANSAAQHAGGCTIDLDIIKNVGSVLCQLGQVQIARDLAEQALQLAGEDKHRQLHSWLAAAEIYQRQGNNHSAIIYMNAALVFRGLTISEYFIYSNIIIRIFREIGMLELAYQSISVSRSIFKMYDMELYEKNKTVYDFLFLTINYIDFKKNHASDNVFFSSLIHQMGEIAKREIVAKGNIAPILTLSLQILDYASNKNICVDSEIKILIEELSEEKELFLTPEKLLAKFKGFYKKSDVNSLFELYKLNVASRYASDRAYDDHNLHFYASVFLRKNVSSNVQDNIFAIEMLADHSISINNSLRNTVPTLRYTTIDEPMVLAQEYATRNNVNVFLLGLNDAKKAILVCCQPGSRVEVITTGWSFNYQNFVTWKELYPYEYGFYDARENPNLFYDTINFIEFEFKINTTSVFIFDIMLQSIVTNLIINDSGFLGAKVPVYSSPSIAWLQNIEHSSNLTNGKLVSWISTADSEGYTLKTMADTFTQENGVFEKWGVMHSGGNYLPEGFERSELVIVAAHGGVTESLRQFRSISDEGNLRVNYSSFAKKLSQCGVVILFVCNSGRFDHHPDAVTTVGLTKQLIDEGCEAVVSSPWPLDAIMTLKWLPFFMDKWMNGDTLSESVFYANSEIAKAYSYDSSNCLALTIFGNGNRRYQNS
ncbi:tetratricopeptide repeat protein [Pectobacterium versatile]|uniref:tetratricopeptide repeat protein n=1 Tax=Pectobacterium versatile TaxID=2488639 RepID=UPI001F164044|nr:tetratricopeptide repeat protein [Pectobacterium versatile]